MSWKPRLHSSSLAHGCVSAKQPGGAVTARDRRVANVATTTIPATIASAAALSVSAAASDS